LLSDPANSVAVKMEQGLGVLQRPTDSFGSGLVAFHQQPQRLKGFQRLGVDFHGVKWKTGWLAQQVPKFCQLTENIVRLGGSLIGGRLEKEVGQTWPLTSERCRCRPVHHL